MFALNEKIKEFLDEVCIHINCKTVHKDIREELCEHINELKQENTNNGYDEEKALDMAISAMGNTNEIGTKLNHQHKPQTEWSILILTSIIAIIGGVVMFSSSKFAADSAIDFSKYILSAAIGIGTMLAFYYFDYTKLKNFSMFIYLFGVLLLIITMLMGIQINGVKRWLSIGGLPISSPEFSSLFFLIAFAGFLDKYRKKNALNIIKLIILGAFSVFLLLLSSMPAAFLLGITYAVVLLIAIVRNHFSGNKKIQLISLFGSGFITITLFIYNIIGAPYRLERFTIFFSRGKAAPTGMGYQQYMANIWLSLSHWFGKTEATYNGYGLDTALPGATMEYVLINVIVTLGWAIGIVLILLIALFIVRMFITTSKIKNSYGFYLSLSACSILSAQFLISILMNFSLFPLIGINMPLVSYGGTGYVVSMALVGIILSALRRDNLISYREDIIITASQKDIISYSDGKLTIDFNAWRRQ